MRLDDELIDRETMLAVQRRDGFADTRAWSHEQRRHELCRMQPCLADESAKRGCRTEPPRAFTEHHAGTATVVRTSSARASSLGVEAVRTVRKPLAVATAAVAGPIHTAGVPMTPAPVARARRM